MDPFVSLVRRWAVDWIASRDPAVCAEVLAPAYSLLIGGYLLDGREAYVPATLEQLDRFPGLGLTVHDLIASGAGVAVRFTEHGASVRQKGREAGWGGIALFEWDGRQLARCFAEEDYFSRRRQLADGRSAVIEPPAPAPWNTAVGASDPAAEAAVRGWLERGDLAAATLDDGWARPVVASYLEDATIELHALFSAGSRVAFHATQHGRYAGGFDDLDAGGGGAASLHLAGMVTVAAGEVAEGRVVRDRLGLRRALSAAVPS